MIINRALKRKILERIESYSKIIILYGPRQIGKTTLINTILKELPYKNLIINADEKKYHHTLSSCDLDQLKSLVSGYQLVFIDEAQRIENIGLNLKILHDGMPELKIIVSGSSSFELANKIKEPLTGRTWTFLLYPISFLELKEHYNQFELNTHLSELLIYGMYPELFTIENNQDKFLYLKELTSSYLYKDVLELSNIKHSRKIEDLLRLLAFQIGSQVSIAELAQNLGMNKETVENYINLLEQSFVIFRLSGFSRNLRKEVCKMDKIYFYDLGIRNILIDNLKPLSNRDDQGKLWENFLISERKKYLAYHFQFPSTYFWRTYTGAEIDYLEEQNSSLSGFEFKYGSKDVAAPKTWQETYPQATYKCINRENYFEFII